MLSVIIAALAGHVAITNGYIHGHTHGHIHSHAAHKRATTPVAYCSNSDGNYKLSSISAPAEGVGSTGTQMTWNLTVDDTSSGYKQTVTGFGAAVTDATVSAFNTLSSDTLNELLDLLMTSEGANFSLMRHSIGASDLSADPVYTYDDNGGKADTNLTSFNLGDRGNEMAKMLARMKKLQPSLKVLGTPWSPPGWMKLNGVIADSAKNNNLNDGYLVNEPGYSSQFAQYFVKYIQAYEALGATIDAITIQNEPLNSQSGFPTMYMYDSEAANLIQYHVGPALAEAGLDTAIWAYDHNTDVPSFPQTVLNSAGKYVDTVAWHCYANPLDWSVLTNFKKSNPNVTQYMTECWTPSSGEWYQASSFAIGPLQNWASGAMAWTLATNSSNGPHLADGGCTDCTGLVVVNDDGTYTLQTAYYMLAQYSAFIPSGAIILDGSGSNKLSNGAIESVASLNPDGTRTVVIENTFADEVHVTLSTASGEKWNGSIPKNSVVTWVLPKAK